MEDYSINEDVFGLGVDALPTDSSKKRLLVLMIVDVTKSMEGQSIGQLNYGLQEIVSELKQYSTQNAEIRVEFSIVSFSNNICVELPPTDISTYYDIAQLKVRPGLTQYGSVYSYLNRELTKDRLLKCSGKQAAPIIVFMTDGAPADHYQDKLRELKRNDYFMLSNRSAVIMGLGAADPAVRAAVSEFVSKEDMILTAGDYTQIVNSIKLATLHTIMNDNKKVKNQENSISNLGDPMFMQNTPFAGDFFGLDPVPDAGSSTEKMPAPSADPDPVFDPFAAAGFPGEPDMGQKTGTDSKTDDVQGFPGGFVF